MSLERMLIVKTGGAPDPIRRRHGDFDDWFVRAFGPERFDYHTVAVSDNEALPDETTMADYAGVVVTGSPAMVSHRLDWSEATAEWLAGLVRADRLPVLGVCYGHQLMAHALGGRVGPNPHGRRMGTRDFHVEAGDDSLLGSHALRASVHVTHLEVVLEPPDSARVLGRTEGDPHHALHFGGRSWGVQFHPEFDARIMRSYVEARAELLEGEGFDSRAILEGVLESPTGDAVLQEFASICESARGDANGRRR